MQIPIRNVYFMLAYAWGEFEPGELIDVDDLDAETSSDLVALVLVRATERLLKRGFDRGYRTRKQELAGVRGQIDFETSVDRMLFPQGRAVCRVDELTHDIPHNRILKAALERLARTETLDDDLQTATGRLARRMPEVSNVELRSQLFGRVQLDSNSRFYRFVLSVCRLVAENTHLDEGSGAYQFREFLRDDAQMHELFERFVRNFYDREQTAYEVGRSRIAWRASADRSEARRLLPGMETDVTLRGDRRTLIIDTKYYRKTLADFRSEHVRSSHFAQIYAYVKNYDRTAGDVEGVLLYPTVDRSLELEYRVDGHRVRVGTVDLTDSWDGISDRLFGLLPSEADT